MKFKRSERLVDMTHYLLSHPLQNIPFKYFIDKYNAAKSSISEDFAIIKDVFHQQDYGEVVTFAGANGGVEFIPVLSEKKQKAYVDDLMAELKAKHRILPGGYLFLTDLLGSPETLNKIGRLIASQVGHQPVDYILTVETKGIPIAQAVSQIMMKPYLIARKTPKVTEGPTLSVKYTSQSRPDYVQTMEVQSNSIQPGSHVLIVDDFVRAGGTMQAMYRLVEYFDASVVGAYALAANTTSDQDSAGHFESLLSIEGLNEGDLVVRPGTAFESVNSDETE